MAKKYNKNSNDFKARSGATLHTPFNTSKNTFFLTAWKVMDNVMHRFTVNVPAKKGGDKHSFGVAVTTSNPQKAGFSGSPKQWVPVIVKQTAAGKASVIIGGLMDVQNHKVYIKDWNWIINPKASNGGYIGKHISKNYDN